MKNLSLDHLQNIDLHTHSLKIMLNMYDPHPKTITMDAKIGIDDPIGEWHIVFSWIMLHWTSLHYLVLACAVMSGVLGRVPSIAHEPTTTVLDPRQIHHETLSLLHIPLQQRRVKTSNNVAWPQHVHNMGMSI